MDEARPRATRLTAAEAVELAAFAALLAVTTVSSLHGRSGRGLAIAVTVAAMLTAALWALVAYRASQRSNPSMRFALRCFAATATLDVVAHATLWGWYGVIRNGPIPVASPAYVFPILAAALAVVGCISLSQARLRIRLAGILDALLILAGTAFVGWALVLQSIYNTSPGSTFAKTLALIPPSANILLMAVLGPVALRVRSNQRFIARFLACAIPILVSNVAYAYVAARSNYYLGTPIDCGYILTYLGACLLLRRGIPFQEPKTRGAEAMPWAYVAIPYAPIALAGGVLGYLLISGRGLDGFLVGLGLVLVAAGFMRQTLVIAENISLSNSLATSEARFRHMALHDALTGLPNRHLFHDRAAQLGEIAKRSDTTVGVLAIDLDDFKQINDRYGHAVGDEVLIEAGRRLVSVLRGTDTAARMGGDEFSVVFLGGEMAASQVAQRIMTTLSAPYRCKSSDVELRVGSSVGRAIRKPAEDIEDLLRRADREMYSDKASHKVGQDGPDVIN